MPSPHIINESQGISRYRIIAENVFDRIRSLWTLKSSKRRWGEELYDHVTKLCVAVTSFHIESQPLRASDGEFYRRYKNRLYAARVETALKRRLTQHRYRENLRRRLSLAYHLPLEDVVPDTQLEREN